MYTVESAPISAKLVQWTVRDSAGKWVCTARDKATAEQIAAALRLTLDNPRK